MILSIRYFPEMMLPGSISRFDSSTVSRRAPDIFWILSCEPRPVVMRGHSRVVVRLVMYTSERLFKKTRRAQRSARSPDGGSGARLHVPLRCLELGRDPRSICAAGQ